MKSLDPTQDDPRHDHIEAFRSAFDAGEFGDANEAAKQLLASFDGDGEDLDHSSASLLSAAAGTCEQNGDWPGAAAAYQRILALPDQDAFVRWNAHADLAGIYSLLDRRDDAMDESRRAVDAARAADVPVAMTMALADYAKRAIRAGALAEVARALDEALQITSHAAAFSQIKARVLTFRAALAIRRADIDSAAIDLQEAKQLLDPMQEMEIAAGVHADTAAWWEEMARWHAAQHDVDAAIEAWESSLAIRRRIAALPHIAPMTGPIGIGRALTGLAEALTSSGRPVDPALTQERDSILRETKLAHIPAN